LSSHLFLVFGSNLEFVPKNKYQMHFSGQSHSHLARWWAQPTLPLYFQDTKRDKIYQKKTPTGI